MLEPFLKSHWSGADKRARSLSLSLLFLALTFFAASWFYGNNWTIRIGLDYFPEEISIPAFQIPSDLVQFDLNLPHYAFGEVFVPESVMPADWFYPLCLLIFFLAFPLLTASVSYFEGLWLYGSLFLMAAAIAVFEPGLLHPFGIASRWVTAILVLLVLLPVFSISTWFNSWNFARRWWVLLLFYGISSLLIFYSGTEIAAQSKFLAALYLPVLLAALAFIVINSTDVLHGILILLTRSSGNKQSWLHFTIFSVFYLGNFLLIYLKNTGLYELDIYYPNPFFLQIFSLIVGFWVLPAKESMGHDDFAFGKGLFGIYVSLAVFFLLACVLGFGTANDLVTEVLEDGITLINFCMGICFLLYVIINYFDLMQHGLRVHEALFRPRYMPVSGISVFGLAGVMIFLVNSGYFPVFQAMAARYVFFGDQSRREGKAVLAEEMYRQALSLESRNQRANLSLAALYLETGNPENAVRMAQQSLDKNPSAEAILFLAEVYRGKESKLDEILTLQDGVRRFPNDGRILNNLGAAFVHTIYKDSSAYYFSRASAFRISSSAATANLGFCQLTGGNLSSGSPGTVVSPDGDWASLNNQLVFANAAHGKSSSISDLYRRFKAAPDRIRPYLLYHSILNKAIARDSTGTQALFNLEDDSIQKYYDEPVEMAKSLLFYRNGQVFSGMERLLHLFGEGTQKRLDFALLLGQLYYEQGAFAISADFFKQAAAYGMKNAWYWYALASLEAGRKENAVAGFRESLPHLSESDRIRVSILLDGMTGKLAFEQAAKRTDPEKSAYIKLNWKQIRAGQVKDLIHLTSDKESARLLWKYCYDKSWRESRDDFCRVLYQYASAFHGNDKKWQEILEPIRPFHEVILKGNWQALRNLKDIHPYLRALQAEKSSDTSRTIQLFLQALEEDPFNSRNAGFAVRSIFNAGKKDLAYQKALDLTRLDSENPSFLELYAEMALQNGLADFAFQCLPKLEVLAGAERAASLQKKMSDQLNSKGLPVPKLSNP